MRSFIKKIKYYISYITKSKSPIKFKIKKGNKYHYIYLKSNLTYYERKNNKNKIALLNRNDIVKLILRFLKNNKTIFISKINNYNNYHIFNTLIFYFGYNLPLKLYHEHYIHNKNIMKINYEWNEIYESILNE